MFLSGLIFQPRRLPVLEIAAPREEWDLEIAFAHRLNQRLLLLEETREPLRQLTATELYIRDRRDRPNDCSRPLHSLPHRFRQILLSQYI